MKVITLDFETYYSKDFGFSKLTTEEYVRGEQFEVIGVSIKIDYGKTVWFSGTKKDTQRFLNGFDWDTAVVVAHNAMFDMAILNWHFDIRPYKIVDTLSMAKAVHGTEVSGSLAALAQHYGLGEKGTEVMDAIGKRRLDFTPTELQRYAQYCINDTELTCKLFAELMLEALKERKERKKMSVSRSQKQKRLDQKKRRGETKRLRARVQPNKDN